MARRNGAVTKGQGQQLTEKDALELHRAARRHFTRLTEIDGVNMAQFTAQRYEEEMVKVLVGMALDVTGTTAPGLRRQCALDVITVARGVPKPWLNDGQTIDPNAPVGDGSQTMGDLIEAAKTSAEMYEELDGLVRRKVPPEQWPQKIREMVGDAISHFVPVD